MYRSEEMIMDFLLPDRVLRHELTITVVDIFKQIICPCHEMHEYAP